MFKRLSFIVFFLMCLLLISCTQNRNYKTAYSFERKGQVYIKLMGERRLAAHDPSSVLSNRKYVDSLLLQVPSLQNGIINGKDIPVQAGHYKYLGTITIQGNKVQVNLSYDNIDDKKIEPTSWNGEYVLVRN